MLRLFYRSQQPFLDLIACLTNQGLPFRLWLRKSTSHLPNEYLPENIFKVIIIPIYNLTPKNIITY